MFQKLRWVYLFRHRKVDKQTTSKLWKGQKYVHDYFLILCNCSHNLSLVSLFPFSYTETIGLSIMFLYFYQKTWCHISHDRVLLFLPCLLMNLCVLHNTLTCVHYIYICLYVCYLRPIHKSETCSVKFKEFWWLYSAISLTYVLDTLGYVAFINLRIFWKLGLL